MKKREIRVHKVLRAIKSGLIIILLGLSNHSCAAQAEVFKDDDFYFILNDFFSSSKKNVLLEYTVNVTSDIEFLKKPNSWNEANLSPENLGNEKLDFIEVFSKKELGFIVDSLTGMKKMKINKKNVIKNITLLEHKDYNSFKDLKYRVSAPVIVTPSKGVAYLFVYIDSINGIENGHGAIYVYKKDITGW